jgi:hypothetical protein
VGSELRAALAERFPHAQETRDFEAALVDATRSDRAG